MKIPADWPEAMTANGVTVVPGLKVRDYDWNETVVTDRAPSIDGGTPWFYTENGGLFDGSRMLAL